MSEVWKIVGYDALEEEFYKMGSEYFDEESAYAAAVAHLESIEESQPSSDSVGEGDESVQDQVFIIKPDGARYRVLPKEIQDEL